MIRRNKFAWKLCTGFVLLVMAMCVFGGAVSVSAAAVDTGTDDFAIDESWITLMETASAHELKTAESYYDSGQILHRYTYYIDDWGSHVKQGTWTSWFENGQMCAQAEYEHGKMHGKFTSRFENGQMAQQGQYGNGKPCGIWTRWFMGEPGSAMESDDGPCEPIVVPEPKPKKVECSASEVRLLYADGSSEVITGQKTIELKEGMAFTLLDPDTSWIALAGKVITGGCDVNIKHMTVIDEEFKMGLSMLPTGENSVKVYSPQPDPESGEIYPYTYAYIQYDPLCPTIIPKYDPLGPTPMEMLVEDAKVAGNWVMKNKYTIGANAALKIMTGVPCVATAVKYGHYGLGYLLETAASSTGDWEKPSGYGAEHITTPSGQICCKSEGAIEVSADGTTTVYVFDGTFELSDLDKTKTVTVYANQSSTCELGSVPSDPKPFDKSSVDRLWETINKSISFDDIQTENKSISPDDSQTGNWTDDNSGCWETSNGIHTMTGTNEDIKSRYLYHNQELCDFTFQADVRKTSGDKPSQVCTYGLYFRGDGSSKNYYLFPITATGRYLISKKVEGQYTQMLGATPSDSLKTGYNEWNTLTVTARGSTTEFFINDDLVASMGDESFLCGKVGLYAFDSSTSDTPDTVQFRNIQITELEGVTSTPTPTPNPNLLPPQSGFPILP